MGITPSQCIGHYNNLPGYPRPGQRLDASADASLADSMDSGRKSSTLHRIGEGDVKVKDKPVRPELVEKDKEALEMLRNARSSSAKIHGENVTLMAP